MSNKRCIRRIKDTIIDYTDRLELMQALISYRMEICTTGVYSERICLPDEVLELVEEQLDSLVNDFKLLVESGFDLLQFDD